MNANRPLAEFDLMSAEFQGVCYEFYERLHAEQPIYRMPATGVYLITLYDDVRAAALNFEAFSNTTPVGMLQGERWKAYEEVLEKEGWPMEPSLNAIDPPAHRRPELQIAFTTLLRRMSDIALVGSLPNPPHVASWRHRMLGELPIRFTKTAL